MTPCIFVENNDNIETFDKINETISNTNTKLIKQSENGNTKYEDYNALSFNVGKLDIDIGHELVTIFDIPGLNDARTKSIYYKYLEENFIKFNIVLFIVDINSGLNTSDEIDILDFIVNQTIKNNKEKQIYTLVVVNKADDMQLVTNDKLEITGELSEMFDQVKDTITNKFTENNINNQLIDIIPICALDAYLYRMIKSKGSKFNLKPENILKIGTNEMGKKFSKKSSDKQKEEVDKIISDVDFINDMIKLSGFSFLESSLNNFLLQNNKCSSMIIDNLMQQYNKLPNLQNAMLDNYEEINQILDSYEIILKQIYKFDVIKYNALIENELINLHSGMKKVINCDTNINETFAIYADFVEKLHNTFLSDHFIDNNYPKYFVDYIYNLVLNNIQNKNHIFDIILQFNYLIQTKSSKENIDNILNLVVKNKNKNETLSFDEFNDSHLILFFIKLTNYGIKQNQIIRLIRFIILNLIKSYYDEKYIRKMYFKFKQNNEVLLSTYILKNYDFTFDDYIDGFDDKINKLEKFYLSIIKV